MLCAMAMALPANAFADANQARLTVILDQENLPYSSQGGSSQGLDAEIAALLAEKLGRDLKIEWADTLDDGMLTPVVRPQGRVDAAVGVPIEEKTVEDRTRVGMEALFSIPYSATGYVLVTSAEMRDLESFEDIGREEIGAEVGSVAAGELWNQGYILRHLGSQERILTELVGGGLRFGVLWTNAGWMIEQDERFRGKLKIQPVEIESDELRWNVGVAVGRHNRDLLPKIDSAILALRREGIFPGLFNKYHIPYFQPLEQ